MIAPVPQMTSILDEDDTRDIESLLNTDFPDASEEMKILMKDQRMALTAKSSKGYRWSKEVIGTCLDMFIRSPRSSQDLKDSAMLRLPSGRQLRKCWRFYICEY